MENANLQGASLNGTVFDGSAALVDLVSHSAVAGAIPAYYAQNAPTFDRLVFDVTVCRDDAVALLHLPNVSLATTAVTDLPQAPALSR